MKKLRLVVHVENGTNIKDAIEDLCMLAKQLDLIVESTLNEAWVRVTPDSIINDVLDVYNNIGNNRNCNIHEN